MTKPHQPRSPKGANRKAVKAKVLYVDSLPKKSSDAPAICTTEDALTPNPVFVLPADPESVAQIEEEIASMIFVPLNAPKGETNRIAQSIMHAPNLTPPAPKGGK